MPILLLCLILCAQLILPLAAWSAIVGTSNICKGGGTAGSASITCTMPGNTTAGNFIVCGITAESTTEADWTGLSDGTTSGTGRATTWGTNDFQGTKIFDIQNITTLTTPTMTATFSGTPGFRGMICREYSGVATSSAFDQGAFNAQDTGNSATDGITSGNVTTTQADELLWSTTTNTDSSTPFVAGTNFTQVELESTAVFMQAEQRIVSSTGTYAGLHTFNPSVTDNTATNIATYKQAGGGGGAAACRLALLGVGC